MTLLADIIKPEVFNPYLVEKTADMAKFYMGGIVSNDSMLDGLALKGGNIINMPFWQDLNGNDEVLSDTSPLSVGKISAKQDAAVLLMRGKGWTVNDLATALSGERDIMGKIAELVADFQARKQRDALISSMEGVLASNIANNSGDMIADLSAATNAGVSASTKLNADSFVDGQATFGDMLDGVHGVGMHPDVYYGLLKIDKTSFEKESMGGAVINTYRGKRLIVDRGIPFTPAAGTAAGDAAALYTTYLFGNGAFGLGQGAAPVPIEPNRQAAAGNDELFIRSHYILHPRGNRFLGAAVVGSSPTNAELANGANWSRVYERENVRIAAIITNG